MNQRVMLVSSVLYTCRGVYCTLGEIPILQGNDEKIENTL
jgi:hypothetical protein